VRSEAPTPLLCSSWSQGREAERQHIRQISSRSLDWRCLLLLAQHHRLGPLANRVLHASVALPLSRNSQTPLTAQSLRVGYLPAEAVLCEVRAERRAVTGE